MKLVYNLFHREPKLFFFTDTIYKPFKEAVSVGNADYSEVINNRPHTHLRLISLESCIGAGDVLGMKKKLITGGGREGAREGSEFSRFFEKEGRYPRNYLGKNPARSWTTRAGG